MPTLVLARATAAKATPSIAPREPNRSGAAKRRLDIALFPSRFETVEAEVGPGCGAKRDSCVGLEVAVQASSDGHTAMSELTNDEQALMKRVASGDRQALALVVRALMGRVQALAIALLGNTADARDASQASLVEIIRAAPSFRGDCSLGYWASRITARTSVRWVSRERRLRGGPPPDLGEPTVPESGPAHVLLAECLATLPSAQRVTLLLRCGLGYSVDEIAELTSAPPNTVKDRLLRGRAALRKLVELQESTPRVNSQSGT